MSRKLVKNDPRALDDVPLFRAAAAKVDAVLAEVDEAAAEEIAEDRGVGDGEDLAADEVDAALQSLEDPAPTRSAEPAQRVRLARVARGQPGALHGLWTGLGIALFVAGIALACGEATRPASLIGLLDALARIGLSPTLLMGFGCSAWGVGTLLGRQNRQSETLARVEASVHDLLGVAEQVEEMTRALHTADATRAATATSGDEFGQVLFALQRNEDKLINLTRATKTFGKPLVEMTTQLAEAAGQWGQTQSMIQALRVASENGLGRLEEALLKQTDGRSLGPSDELRHDLDQLRMGLQGKLDLAMRELKAGPDVVQHHVQALGANLESALVASTQKLSNSLDGVGKDLGSKLAGLGGGKQSPVDLTPVQNAIADLRRELTSLLGSNGVRQASVPAAAAPAPVASPAPAAAAPATDATPANGLAQSIAGERATGGSNVLGAIAKLKKMRS